MKEEMAFYGPRKKLGDSNAMDGRIAAGPTEVLFSRT
jgi:hypothetical protein